MFLCCTCSWTLLLSCRPTGQRRRFTPSSSVVQPAVCLAPKRSKFGLIGDRPCLLTITVASGRNFITAPAAQLGGPGAAIAPPPTSPRWSRMAIARIPRRPYFLTACWAASTTCPTFIALSSLGRDASPALPCSPPQPPKYCRGQCAAEWNCASPRQSNLAHHAPVDLATALGQADAHDCAHERVGGRHG